MPEIRGACFNKILEPGLTELAAGLTELAAGLKMPACNLYLYNTNYTYLFNEKSPLVFHISGTQSIEKYNHWTDRRQQFNKNNHMMLLIIF